MPPGDTPLGFQIHPCVDCRKAFQNWEEMVMPDKPTLRMSAAARACFTLLAALFSLGAVPASAQEPIKIGFSMALTGPLSPNGKQALLGMKIWEEETNAAGGLLGRPVKLIYYDDQTNASTVPGIYTKLIDVDK